MWSIGSKWAGVGGLESLHALGSKTGAPLLCKIAKWKVIIMLKKFSVENFKGFKDKITLDIGTPSNYSFNSEIIENGCIYEVLVLIIAAALKKGAERKGIVYK